MGRPFIIKGEMEMFSKIQETFNFDNIGGKIKTFAKWGCWISIVLIWIAAVLGILISVIELLGGDDDLANAILIPAVIYVILGPLAIWIGSWTTYALGEMVEKQTSIEKTLLELARKNNSKLEKETEKKANDIRSIVCANCSTINSEKNRYCVVCGYELNSKKEENKNAAKIEIKTPLKDYEGMWNCPQCGKSNLDARATCWCCGEKKPE